MAIRPHVQRPAVPALYLILFPILILGNCNSNPAGASGPQAENTSPPRLEHHEVTADSLPPPFATQSVEHFSRNVRRPPGAQLVLPPGFEIHTYAEGFAKLPRWMALAPNGDVFVSDSPGGSIFVLRDSKGAGKADQVFTFARGLRRPFGLAFWHDDDLYVADTDAVLRFHYQPGQTKASGVPEKIADLPADGYNNHWTRNVIFNLQGTKMYVTVGSGTNDSVESNPMRATINEYNPDGTGHRIVASGTRNPVGLAFNPQTGRLWAAVEERDRLGDNLPPDYLIEVKDDGFYGWPYAYIGPHEDPWHKGQRPDLVAKTLTPDVLFQAHSAVLGLAFYTGGMFPKDYQGDAFVALHGSWNRALHTGYKVVRVRFHDGEPAGGYDDFVKGWMTSPTNPDVWGRPAGLLMLKDGSLLIDDDGAKKIWRVTYKGGSGELTSGRSPAGSGDLRPHP